MTEVGEAVAILVAVMDKKEKCAFEPEKTDWACNLSGSSTALAAHMGQKPHATQEKELTSGKWPSQAHHLIPHKQLASHKLAKWLRADGVLYGDTRYNVDHKNNGKWMPYASGLAEWAGAGQKKKRELMFKLMALSGIQLHQGRHSSSNTYAVGALGYKDRVDQYLDKIVNNAISHYVGPPPCADCKGKQQAQKCPPRDNSVRYVDRASSLIEKDIDTCLIFVSRIAAEFAEAGGFDG
jgi:hypothetical protein